MKFIDKINLKILQCYVRQHNVLGPDVLASESMFTEEIICEHLTILFSMKIFNKITERDSSIKQYG